MSLTKEECELSLKALYDNIPRIDETEYGYEFSVMNQLIKEHFDLAKENERLQSQLLECQRVCQQKQEIIDELRDNPPLKFDDLEPGIWIWDNKLKMYRRIEDIDPYAGTIQFERWKFMDFEENRFYRKEVKQNG